MDFMTNPGINARKDATNKRWALALIINILD
jgi:hypothetical protein